MDFRYPKDLELPLAKALSLEWLETNELGGYSSSTIINSHTRKYHGLLVSKIESLTGKYVLLNKVEDILLQDGKENFLTAHSYPDFFQEGSFANLQEFKLTTHPIWNFKFVDLRVTKELLMLAGENTILLKYIISSAGSCQLIFRPLLSFRNFHQLQQENPDLRSGCEILADGFVCEPYPGMGENIFSNSR